jgi:phosphoribosylamine--glycine ligase
MRILVAGSGGREHALVWKIARSPLVERVLAAPGNPGMERDATCHPAVSAGDAEALLGLCERENVDLVVVGPEDPLAEGLADRLREAGLLVFGPSAAAARLEASKSWAREFMHRHGIPQPAFRRHERLGDARAHVRALGGRCVVKADGLCAGKGVWVCAEVAEADRALDEIMGERRFGEAGAAVVVEEVLEGEEASYYAITDGEHLVTLPPAQDHKRALDGDLGENTGGMGAYAPAPVVTRAVEKRILEEIVHPALRGMREEGTPYTGVLYCGLMIDAAGAPRVVEFNVRFGDPETQPLMVQLESDLVPLLVGSAQGALDPGVGVAADRAAVCVVLASGGYPRSYETGRPISGLAEAEALEGVVVFHSGTRREGSGFVTAGGRVLGVTASGADVAEARSRAYAAAERIRFEGRHLRSDIGDRALTRGEGGS